MAVLCKFLTWTVFFIAFSMCSHASDLKLSIFLKDKFRSEIIIMEGDSDISNNYETLARILTLNTPNREKIKSISDKCDYQVTVYNGAFILSKKYSDR